MDGLMNVTLKESPVLLRRYFETCHFSLIAGQLVDYWTTGKRPNRAKNLDIKDRSVFKFATVR